MILGSFRKDFEKIVYIYTIYIQFTMVGWGGGIRNQQRRTRRHSNDSPNLPTSRTKRTVGSFLDHFQKKARRRAEHIFPKRQAPAHRAQGWNIPFRGTSHSDAMSHDGRKSRHRRVKNQRRCECFAIVHRARLKAIGVRGQRILDARS